MWRRVPADPIRAAARSVPAAGAPVRVRVLLAGAGRSGMRVWSRDLAGAVRRIVTARKDLAIDILPTSLRDDIVRIGGGDGPDFLALSRLHEAGAGAGDSIAGLGSDDGSARLAVVPANARRSVRVLLDPPLLVAGEQLIGDLPRLAPLVAASSAAIHLASAFEPDGTEPGSTLARFIGDIVGVAGAEAGGGEGTGRALAAWADAWRGIGDGDEVRLERARSALDLALNTGAGAAPGIRAHARGTLALVLLGLGGSAEGTRRLAEALAEARRAVAEAGRARPARATLMALAGRIALALGRLRGDEVLLGDARARLIQAQHLAREGYLPGACGLEGLSGEVLEAERALGRLGRAPRRPARAQTLVRSGPS